MKVSRCYLNKEGSGKRSLILSPFSGLCILLDDLFHTGQRRGKSSALRTGVPHLSLEDPQASGFLPLCGLVMHQN